LRGTSAYWIETLTRWALEPGFDAFVFWPEQPSLEQVELFAREVAPAVRETVEQKRARA